MKPVRPLLFVFILICVAAPAQAADINAASCSDTDVQAAIDSAVDGDRVLVPAGNCIWNASPVVEIRGKGITLQGAGIGQTVITDNTTGNWVIILFPDSTSGMMRVTGFTFVRGGTDKIGNLGTIVISGIGNFTNKYRIDNFELLALGGTGIAVFQDGFLRSGVIDNCTIEMNSGSGDKSIRVFGDVAASDTAFSHTPRYQPGTAEGYVFIEDCTFNFSDREDGALDAFAGARYVFRHNTVNNTNVEHHGLDGGGFRGIHSCEIYENTFNRTTTGNIRSVFYRSGVCLTFNNTWTGNYFIPTMANYRSRPQDFGSGYGQCDGSSSWDENQPGLDGYACVDQVGHLFTENPGGANDLEGTYFWGNTLDGSPITTSFVSDEGRTREHLQEGRDFYTETTTFNGTSGVGVGTLANRSSTCTPQVSYWATDTEELYQCTLTDTWSLHYTPFTYPHPLRSADPPPEPPKNLTVDVQ